MSSIVFGIFGRFSKTVSMSGPPPVPDYWHFASVVLESASNFDSVQERFLQLCEMTQLHMRVSAPWVWHLELCQGLHYIEIECNVFKKEGQTVLDINLLQGNRALYWQTVQKMRAGWHGETAEDRPTSWTMASNPTPALAYDQLPTVFGFELLTTQMDVEQLLPYLENTNSNIVRRAMLVLSQTAMPATAVIRKWAASCNCTTFLEREIQKSAQEIVSRDSASLRYLHTNP